EHTVATDNKMFKIIRSVLTLKDGKYSAQITLSGTGYDKLYCGTAEQAASDSVNWITYSGSYDYEDAGEAKTGYVFNIPVAAVNEAIPLAAYSVSKGVWYDRNVTFTVIATEPTPDPSAEPTVTPEPTPTPSPTPAPTAVTVPTPGKVNSSTSLKDGTYTPDKFSWSGGSSRTSISCSKVTVKNGKAYATISFSSSSYAYVKASGSKYYGSVVGGRSTFEIPVKLNANNKIVGMTTAMSADHEIAYTIYVYLKTAESTSSGNTQSTTVQAPAAAQIIGMEYISTDAIAHSWLYKVHRYSQGCVAIEVAGVGKYLVVPENAELPVGIEEEAVIIRQPIMRVHSSSTNAMQMIQGIIGEETEMTISFWDYTAPDYAALLKSGSDLIIMPESFAGNDDAAIADVHERLDMLGIPMFVDRSADEETEAAKLEWIKVYGILLGCEEAANACYETAVAALEVQA
ncbi:MAG: hypothetical protein J6M10_01170, partial [Clostridia bacterium]|nr:hypothetical protein [Clostridia bacterium]